MPIVDCPIEGCSYQTPDLGDTIVAALLTTHCTVHTVNLGNSAPKVEKVKRPSISSAGTSEEWAYFISRWNDYVQATKITGQEKVIQLLECCEETLRKDLTQSAGGSLINKPVETVIAAIKTLAVREENVMVARVTLHNMRQDRDETVRSFGARLRGQAGICKFNIQCPSCDLSVNYTDAILRDTLTRGIEDPEIQLELLGNPDQDMTLEQVFKFVEAKESGKRSASRLVENQNVDSSSSSYRKTQKQNVKQKINTIDKSISCSFCGKKGHGRNSPYQIRKEECPAFGKTCNHCNRENHFETACRQKKTQSQNSPPASKEDSTHNCDEGATFDRLCSISSPETKKSIAIDHHLSSYLIPG